MNQRRKKRRGLRIQLGEDEFDRVEALAWLNSCSLAEMIRRMILLAPELPLENWALKKMAEKRRDDESLREANKKYYETFNLPDVSLDNASNDLKDHPEIEEYLNSPACVEQRRSRKFS